MSTISPFTISYDGDVLLFNGKKLDITNHPSFLQCTRFINSQGVIIARSFYKFKTNMSKEDVLASLMKETGLQLRLNSSNNDLEVYCNETESWKVVDKLKDDDCSHCKKAQLAQRLYKEWII